MRIGELALFTGTRASTIRYYEQIGLLPAPKRINGSHRRYDDADVERLGFIRRCRALGFSLNQIHQFARIAQSGGPATDHCRKIVQDRLVSVRARIAEMRAVEARLAELLADGTANAGSTIAPCARLAVLA
jgi:DNA-binding transcriptional MerR regulator